MATIFRAPLLTPNPKRPFIAPDLIPNLLLTTLAVVAGVPFHQSDWPTPSRRPVLQVEQPPNVTLRRKQPPKKGTVDFIPVRARSGPALEVAPNVSILLGLPTPPLIMAVDLPTPARARSTPPVDPPNTLIGGIPSTAVAPFGLDDWPTPTRARSTPPDFLWAGTLARGIPYQPFWTADGWGSWTADGWPVWSADGFLGPAITPLNLTADFPNPAGRKPATGADPPPNLLVSTLVAPAVLPPGEQSFDTPVPRSRLVRFDDPPNVALNAPIVPTLPFRQSEQPLPPIRAKAVPYAETGPNTTVRGIPPALLPFALADWPVPGRSRALNHEPGFAKQLSQASSAPFGQSDWPPPARSKWLLLVEIAPNSVLPGIPPQTFWTADGWPGWTADGWPVWSADGFIGPAGTPFNQPDWLTPSRARPVAFDAPPNLLCSTLRPSVVLPFSLKEWPNPVRARRGDQNVIVGNSLIAISPPAVIITLSRDQFHAAREMTRFEVDDEMVKFIAGREVKKFPALE